MEIVVKDSFKVVGIVVESDWQNIHQKMAVAWQEFKQRVGEIEQRKGNHFLDISLAVNDGIFQQMIRNLQATICLVIGLIFVSSFAWASSDRIGVAGPLTFGKTAFELAWSNQPSYQYYVQKYLPKGETLEDFSQQLAIHLVITNAKPEAAVQEQIRYLDERQDSFDPVVNYAVSKSPDGRRLAKCIVKLLNI